VTLEVPEDLEALEDLEDLVHRLILEALAVLEALQHQKFPMYR
jgi:hypothetical protein